MNRASCTVADGPWTISPDVAWLDGEDILLLDLRPPYARLPWRLSPSAAAVWDGLASGQSVSEIIADLGDAAFPGRVAADVQAFVAELRERGYIHPHPVGDIG